MVHSAEHALKAMDFAIPEIDRMNIVVLGPSGSSARETVRLVMIFGKARPCEPEKMLKAIGDSIRQTRRGARTFYSDAKGQAQSMCFADKRTVLIGPAAALEKCLDETRESHPGPTANALNLAAAKRLLVAGANIELVRELAEQFLRAAEEDLDKPAPPNVGELTTKVRKLLRALPPLLRASYATVTVDACDESRADLRLSFATEEESRAGERAVKTVGELIRDLSKLRNVLAAEVGPDFEDSWTGIITLFTKRMIDSPKAASVSRDGGTLTVHILLEPIFATLIELRPTGAAKIALAADRITSTNNLHRIALAMHVYHDRHGTLPPAAIHGRDGKPLLSWRVAILPDLGEEALYREFKLDQPWDSPHNKKLLARIPKVYVSPRGAARESSTTYYQVFHGKGAAFEGTRGVNLQDFPDGIANTLLVVEAGEPVPWTQPKDLDFAPDRAPPRLKGPFKSFVQAAFADGSVRTIKSNISETVLRALITRNGGEVLGDTPPSYKEQRPLSRAEAALERGDVDLAISCYGEALHVDPKNADAYYYRGNLYGMKAENNRAIADYTEALRLNPKFFLAYLNRAAAYRKRGEFDKAIADLSEAIPLEYAHPAAYIFKSKAYRDRGDAYLHKGQYDKAIADFTEAIQMDSKYAEAYDSRGTAYATKGELDRALADYTEAIRLDPKWAPACYNRGVTWWKKGNWDQALGDYSEAIRRDPRFAAAYLNRGVAYDRRKEYDAAIADYTKAIQLDPKYFEAYLDRGMAHGKKQEYDEAVADFSEAIRLNPKSALAYESRAHVYRALGNETDAARDDQKVKELSK
jgi:tetratricopeptide (TPR) repeat protein